MKKNNKSDNKNGLTSIYTVTENQTLYDVAIDIHGTVDGISDILVNNTNISVDSELFGGMKLIYTSGQTIEQDVVEQLDAMGIIPVNPIRKIYPKNQPDGKILDIYANISGSTFSFVKSGNKFDILIDWGDNTDIERLSPSNNNGYHQFSLEDSYFGERKIRLYINKNEESPIDITIDENDGVDSDIMVYQSIKSNNFVSYSNIHNTSFLRLFDGLKTITLHKNVDSIIPISLIESLTQINIYSKKIHPSDLDNFFISIIDNYGKRIPANININSKPSGTYKEPQKTESGEYIVQNGMEAVWLLTNEESWNSDYYKWKITIDGVTYIKEK